MDRSQVIEALNHDLRAELRAVGMYAAHAGAIPQQVIARGMRAIMDVEQRHAHDLAARIQSLGGTPAEVGSPDAVAGRAQSSTADMLRMELDEEQQAIRDYAAQIAEIMDDEETLDLLEEHLADEMRHARWLKVQIAALNKE
jgi:bacterioferritin (cytochrome b1)